MQYSACRVVVCGAWNKRSEAVVLSRSAKSWATREVVEGPRCMGVSISVAVWELEPGSRPGSQSRTWEHGVELQRGSRKAKARERNIGRKGSGAGPGGGRGNKTAKRRSFNEEAGKPKHANET